MIWEILIIVEENRKNWKMYLNVEFNEIKRKRRSGVERHDGVFFDGSHSPIRRLNNIHSVSSVSDHNELGQFESAIAHLQTWNRIKIIKKMVDRKKNCMNEWMKECYRWGNGWGGRGRDFLARGRGRERRRRGRLWEPFFGERERERGFGWLGWWWWWWSLRVEEKGFGVFIFDCYWVGICIGKIWQRDLRTEYSIYMSYAFGYSWFCILENSIALTLVDMDTTQAS